MRTSNLPKNVYYRYGFGRKPLQETIDTMIKIMDQDRNDVYLIDFSRNILIGLPSHDTKAEIERLFLFVQNGMRYVRDPLDIELIIHPAISLQKIEQGLKKSIEQHKPYEPIAQGDCDDHSILLATLLLTVGIPARFKVISEDKNSDYHHIYVEAYNDKENRWVALDPIHKDKPRFRAGDEVRYAKSKIFDLGIQEAYE